MFNSKNFWELPVSLGKLLVVFAMLTPFTSSADPAKDLSAALRFEVNIAAEPSKVYPYLLDMAQWKHSIRKIEVADGLGDAVGERVGETDGASVNLISSDSSMQRVHSEHASTARSRLPDLSTKSSLRASSMSQYLCNGKNVGMPSQ